MILFDFESSSSQPETHGILDRPPDLILTNHGIYPNRWARLTHLYRKFPFPWN